MSLLSRAVRLTVIAFVALAGCGKLRASPLEECPDFETEVKPLVAFNCTGCHAADSAAGGYQTDTYAHLVSLRADGSMRLVPGDEGSTFITAVSGDLPKHPQVTGEKLTLLKRWVRCRAPGRENQYHLNGWGNPGDGEQFHGKALRAQAYSMDSCRACHGADLRGGKAADALPDGCYQCHTKGPLACNTCHGDVDSPAPPRAVNGVRTATALGVGAHRSHVMDGPLHKGYDCTACHREVKDPEMDRHYQNSGHLDPLPAEVKLAAQAAPGKVAVWSEELATCANVKCHAPSVDGDARSQEPKWTQVGSGQAACGTCHGLPPSSHSPTSTNCGMCHSRVAANSRAILSPALHVNGAVELGDGTPGCSACHGDATSPAPPRDLSGATDAGLVSIGAHRAHLNASRFRGPIACAECHRVPSVVRAPGHLDHALPAQVFPDAFGVGELARADSAQPTWSHGLATCTNVYCHGGGAASTRDNAASVNRAPRWTGGQSQAVCGSCHGVPPQDGFHDAGTQLSQCQACHGASIAGDGTFRYVTVDGGTRALHVDGVVQLGAQ